MSTSPIPNSSSPTAINSELEELQQETSNLQHQLQMAEQQLRIFEPDPQSFSSIEELESCENNILATLTRVAERKALVSSRRLSQPKQSRNLGGSSSVLIHSATQTKSSTLHVAAGASKNPPPDYSPKQRKFTAGINGTFAKSKTKISTLILCQITDRIMSTRNPARLGLSSTRLGLGVCRELQRKNKGNSHHSLSLTANPNLGARLLLLLRV
ncbi:hypothetical protein L484_016621 [Morus notabilis]|uniref:Uncharacterized protein n=1 Tax=Morus notabilis TaxID=981085 RepID=W9QL12_9ROSA|nr:hypothetical protein L484_016621 [Morus notabilis]